MENLRGRKEAFDKSTESLFLTLSDRILFDFIREEDSSHHPFERIPIDILFSIEIFVNGKVIFDINFEFQFLNMFAALFLRS